MTTFQHCADKQVVTPGIVAESFLFHSGSKQYIDTMNNNFLGGARNIIHKHMLTRTQLEC